MIVWDSGAFVDAEAVRISPFDRGFLLGDGVFETLRVVGDRAERFEAHHHRLRAAAKALAIALPFSGSEIERAAVELAHKNNLRDAAVRVTVTRGEGPRGLAPPAPALVRVLISCAPAPGPRGPAVLALSSIRRARSAVASLHKTLSYTDNIAALIEARRHAPDADDALILDDCERVSGTTMANIFWVKGGGLFTPSIDCAIRPGVTREALLHASRQAGSGAVQEVAAPLDDLLRADAVFITNTLIGVRPVVTIHVGTGGHSG